MKLCGIELTSEGLKKSKLQDWLVRFVFGGMVSAGSGLMGLKYGPVVGGLFLGFPSILPAALTLVKRDDGRPVAADDAQGAALGSLSLVGFALIVEYGIGPLGPTIAFGAATLVWLVLSFLTWKLIMHLTRS